MAENGVSFPQWALHIHTHTTLTHSHAYILPHAHTYTLTPRHTYTGTLVLTHAHITFPLLQEGLFGYKPQKPILAYVRRRERLRTRIRMRKSQRHWESSQNDRSQKAKSCEVRGTARGDTSTRD